MRFGGDPLSEDGLEGGETLPQALTLNTYKPTLRNKPYYVAEYSLVDVLESTFIHACKILVCPCSTQYLSTTLAAVVAIQCFFEYEALYLHIRRLTEATVNIFIPWGAFKPFYSQIPHQRWAGFSNTHSSNNSEQ